MAEDIMHMDNYQNILAVAERAKIVIWNMIDGKILHQILGKQLKRWKSFFETHVKTYVSLRNRPRI